MSLTIIKILLHLDEPTGLDVVDEFLRSYIVGNTTGGRYTSPVSGGPHLATDRHEPDVVVVHLVDREHDDTEEGQAVIGNCPKLIGSQHCKN